MGVQTGTDECVVEHTTGAVRDSGTDRLARCLAGTPDKRTAALTANEPLRISYLERVKDPGTSLEAFRKDDHGAQSTYEHILELAATEAQSFFEEACPGDRLTMSPTSRHRRLCRQGQEGWGCRRQKREGCLRFH